MYFDAVLDLELNPVFNGSPGKTHRWLKEHPGNHDKLQVCLGMTLDIITVEQYLNMGRIMVCDFHHETVETKARKIAHISCRRRALWAYWG